MTPESPNILVIRRDNIGDLVCTTPLIRALRAHLPRARVSVLVNSYNRAVVENNPDIDSVYAYTKAKHRAKNQSLFGVYWQSLRLRHELRRRHFDYAILAGASFLPRVLGLARAIRPQHIIGCTEPGKFGTRYIDMPVTCASPSPMHEVEYVFRLLAPLGIQGVPPAMQVFPAADFLAHADAALHAKKFSLGRIIGVHISARKASNRWPAEKFIALMERLSLASRTAFILFWSPGSADNPRHPGDDEKAQKILSALPKLPILAYPTDDLGHLVAGLARCQAVICSDGGAMHIAAALGRPILCFFGKSDKTRWYPWGARYVLLQPPSLEVADIDVDEATHAFEKLMGGPQGTPVEPTPYPSPGEEGDEGYYK